MVGGGNVLIVGEGVDARDRANTSDFHVTRGAERSALPGGGYVPGQRTHRVGAAAATLKTGERQTSFRVF